MIKTYIYRYVTAIIVLLFGSSLVLTNAVYAISADDINAAINNTAYFDPKDNGTGVAACAAPGANVTSPGGGTLGPGSSVYILGDSITEGASTSYTNTFQQKNITTYIDASRSRSIDGSGQTGNKLSGIKAIDADQKILELPAVKAIIIALGTNPTNTASNVANLIKQIKQYNTWAPIYWIDTIVINKQNYVHVIQDANTAIYNGASVNGEPVYTTISWFKAVSPNSDPLNVTGDETDTNGYINIRDTYNVHPTPKGAAALASLVASSVAGETTTDPTSGAKCYAPNGTISCDIPGAEPSEKAYNFFIGKGLNPLQAAAFLGNMQEEAHFEPRLVEYGYKNSRGEISRPNSPSSLDDQPPPNQPSLQDGKERGQPGYGIIQWSGGRKATLSAFASSTGKPVNSLCLQLDFIWSELNDPNQPYKKNTLDVILAATTVDSASETITRHYEIPGNIEAAVARRIVNSRNWLTKYGSN